jgi:HlyD family secretion protein
MRNRIIFSLALFGVAVGCVAAYLFANVKPPQPPLFSPAVNPYTHGIFANGIVESDQPTGENINIYPEVPGTVRAILVAEGQAVHKGQLLIEIDDSVQRATVEQQQSQAQAARALLEELQAQPRKENLDVAKAQVDAALASVKTTQDALLKQANAYELNPKSISKDALDSASNAAAVARANLEVAQKQYDLIKAGAWSYDIRNQEKQTLALEKAVAASSALLTKYTLRAPRDGVVMAVNPAVGSFVSTLGAYESYTQAATPVMVLGAPQNHFSVRCYVDEILVPRLPEPSKMKAQMAIRGTDIRIPLQYVRVQPLVSPKIELSDQRQERVDVRVLPIIFRTERPRNVNLYPGQLVDIYIGE